jgi:PAS domain S-box-containing protein
VTGARTILVADEGNDSREAIKFWLRQAGFEVLTASNAAQLMECVEHRPDVIVLDTELPGRTGGFEIANRLKREPATSNIPIIHVAPGFTTGEWRAQGLEAGADAFLTRPVEPQELIATVRALLRVRAAEEEVRIAAEQWAATFDAITDAVCILDASGSLTRCNEAAHELLDSTEGQGDRPFQEIFPPPESLTRDAVGAAISSGEPLRYEVRRGEQWFDVRLDPIPPGDDEAPSVVAVISDVTARRQADEERARLLQNAERARKEAEISRLEAEAARTEAEQASRAKSEFLAVMSHELRTPLNAIDGYAELLELEVRGPITETQRDDIRRIRRSQKHLLSLINDVLNFVRLDSGTVHYEVTDFELADAVHDVEVVTTPQLRARELQFVRRGCDGLHVRADREKVEQILVNLMTNAIKFTEPDGEITLECASDDGRVTVQVRDTGRGIPADKLSVIFEPFVQVARSPSAPSEGVGLGLAISRELSRAMGGDLVAESAVGKGSTFTLTLPAARAN